MTEYVTTQEAAEISGYSEEYVRRLIRQHKVEAERKGGQFWIVKESLSRYLSEVQRLGTQRFNWRRQDDN